MIMLGAFIGATQVVSYDTLIELIKEKMGKKKDLLEMNLRVADEGYQYATNQLKLRAQA